MIVIQRKFVYIAVLTIVTLLLWLYYSVHTEINKTILYLDRNNNFKRKTFLSPNNSTCKESPFIIILVTSYVGHVELRSAHRRAMPPEILNKYYTERIFLLAKIPQREHLIKQEAIEDENKIFGDILQGTFEEHYRNLTYKHLMGLDWAANHCDKAKYILKVDDDTVFNLDATYNYLKSLEIKSTNSVLLGYMLNNTIPRRQKQNKWYVTYNEYRRSVYPPYLSGWYYVTTPTTAGRLVDEAIYHPYFWIDDILITGILAEAIGIQLKQLPRDYWLEYYEQLECCLRDMILKGIRCEYAVGPNGGRNNLIYEFNEATKTCEKNKNCTNIRKRPLKLDCIAFKDRVIFSNGLAEIRDIKL